MMGEVKDQMVKKVIGAVPKTVVKGAVIGGGLGTVVGLTSGVVIVGTVGAIGLPVTGVVGLGAIGVSTLIGSVAGVGVGAYAGYKLDVYYRTMGLVPPPVLIRRLPDETIDDEKRAVLELSDIKIIDADLIKEAIDLQLKDPDDPETQKKSKELNDFSAKHSYSVKLVLKNQNVTFAELDYSNWEDNPNFDIEITRKEGKEQVEVSEEEKQKVLDSLKRMPKFLGDRFFHPGAVATEEMGESSNYADGVLGGRVGGLLDAVINKVKSVATGKAQAIEVDLEKGPSEKIQTDEFLDELADEAIRTGKYKEYFGHYEEVITKSKDLKLDLEERKKRAEKAGLGFAPSLFVVGSFGVAALLLFGLGVASIFPPISSAIAAVMFVALSSVPFIATLVTGYFAYKKRSVDKQIKNIAKERERTYEELEEKFSGLDATKDMLQELTESHEHSLNLENQHLGDSCARIISRWISSDAGKFCSELKLSNNKITKSGVTKLILALKEAPNIRTLDLRGNPIEAEGIEAITDVLSNNITLTSFFYDKGILSSSKEVASGIERQLLINKYLQDPSISVVKYFKNEGAIQEAAIRKIKSIDDPKMIMVSDAASSVIRKALVARKLELMFAELGPRGQEILVQYASVYDKIDSEDFEKVDQEVVLEAIKESMFKPVEKSKEAEEKLLKVRFVSNPGLDILRDMKEQDRIDLFARCFSASIGDGDSDNRHAYCIAALNSRLMDFEGVFDPENNTELVVKIREYLEQITKWDEESKWRFDEYIIELGKLEEMAYGGEADKINDILQFALQRGLEGDFDFLHEPYRTPTDEEIVDLIIDLERKIKYDGLISYDFPEPNNIHKKAKTAIKNVFKVDDLCDVLGDILDDKLEESEKLEEDIEKFLKICDAIDPEYFTDPPMDSAKLIHLIKSDTLNISRLKEVNEAQCIALLELCFQGLVDEDEREEMKDDSKYKALLVNNMIRSERFFIECKGFDIAPEEFLRMAFFSDSEEDLDKVLMSYEDLKGNLNYELICSLNVEKKNEAVVVDGILQPVMQAKLEDNFECLLPPFGVDGFRELKKVLEKDFKLRSFDFSEKSGIDGEVKIYIEGIVARNKIWYEIFYGDESSKEARLETFIDVFSEHPDYFKYLLMSREELAEAGIDGDPVEYLEDYVIDNLKDLIISDVSKLGKLEESDRIKLIDSLFVCGDKDSICRHNHAFISKIIGSKDFFKSSALDDALVKSLEKGDSLPDLLEEEIKKAIEEEEEEDLSLALDRVLQTGLKFVLKDEFERLKKDNQGVDLLSLEKELKQIINKNTSLRSYDFEGVEVDEDIKKYTKFICDNNDMDYLIYEYKDGQKIVDEEDLNDFIRLYGALLETGPSHEFVFKKISPLNLLNMIAKDIGSHGAADFLGLDFGLGLGLSKTMVHRFSCKKLREIKKKNPDAFSAMLGYIFTLHGKPEEVKEKVELIGDLLKIEQLFDSSKQDDPFIKSLTTSIYWAMAPWHDGIASDLNGLKDELKKAMDVPYQNSSLENKDEILEVLQEAINFTREDERVEVKSRSSLES